MPTPGRWKPTEANEFVLSLPDDMVRAARDLGIDIAAACQRGLQRAVEEARSPDPGGDDLKTAEAWNDWVERNGLPFPELRHS